ncbi:MAG: peptidyl-prolyl cis-trans isomerase [Bacteroidetes bacterium]|nr:peptidyl-prolyl cis-trans isomerase [Bacteroidota bacterium]
MKFKIIFSILLLFISSHLILGQSHNKFDTAEKDIARQKIDSIREAIVSGKIDFASAAIKFSMDPGSAANGGLYKNIQRGTFVSEFEAVAFSIKEKVVSDVFETEFGYHILMVDTKQGDEINVRHILIIP